MKRFNYRAISLIPGLVKLIERDRPRSSRGSYVLGMQRVLEPLYLGRTTLPRACSRALQTWAPRGTRTLPSGAQSPINRHLWEKQSIRLDQPLLIISK